MTQTLDSWCQAWIEPSQGYSDTGHETLQLENSQSGVEAVLVG